MSTISLGSGSVRLHCDPTELSKALEGAEKKSRDLSPELGVSSLKTNCPNCGAPVDIHAEKCAYCDTPYIKQTAETITLTLDTTAIAKAVSEGIITVNEARRRLGLPPIP